MPPESTLRVANEPVNISASITRPANTTQYAVGDAVSESTTTPAGLVFSNAARIRGGKGTVLSALLIDSANQATKGDFDLFLFESAIGAARFQDNAAFAPTDAELETLVGVISFAASSFVAGNATAGASGNSCCLGLIGSPISFQAGATSRTLYGVLVARSTYTPVSAEKLTVRLSISQE